MKRTKRLTVLLSAIAGAILVSAGVPGVVNNLSSNPGALRTIGAALETHAAASP